MNYSSLIIKIARFGSFEVVFTVPDTANLGKCKVKFVVKDEEYIHEIQIQEVLKNSEKCVLRVLVSNSRV